MDMEGDIFDAFPDPQIPAASSYESHFGEYVHHVTPQRALTFEYQDGLTTPPSSLRPEARAFQPGSDRHNHNRYSSLASNFPGNTARQTQPRFFGIGGCLTPDSTTTSQIEAARQLQSPTEVTPIRSRPLPVTVTSAPTVNVGSEGATAPDIVAWTGEAYNVPTSMNADHLVPKVSQQAGRRSRATSVASTIGQGDFACDGVPGKRCGKRFKTRSALSHHVRCHKPPRQFCSICDSGFYYMKDLSRHMKTHEPRDRHLICNNRACKYHTTPFARRDHLERHILSSGHSQQG